MSALMWNGEDDRITDGGMTAIAGLIDRMPQEFDVGHVQAHTESATATIKFPVAGPVAQAQALDDVLNAAMLARCLHANLAALREAVGRVVAEMGYDTDGWAAWRDLTELVSK